MLGLLVCVATVFYLFYSSPIVVAEEGIEVLPVDCHCRDWYGGCRRSGDEWIDDDTWAYKCSATTGLPATFEGCRAKSSSGSTDKQRQHRTSLIAPNANETLPGSGRWASCDVNEIRIRLQLEPRCHLMGSGGVQRKVGEMFREGVFQWICLETGRWVTGCYYQSEDGEWQLLKVGQIAYNGLVRHTCDRYKDAPGRVQYHAQVRDEVAYKSVPGKARNRNFPEWVDNRLRVEPVAWTHQNVRTFIADDEPYTRVRYLPRSRDVQQPPTAVLTHKVEAVDGEATIVVS